MQGLLNDWRRTNYAKDTTPEIAGEDVTIMGWVHEIRDLGGIIFVIIRDVTGRVQITAPSKKVDAEILEELRAFRKESEVFECSHVLPCKASAVSYLVNLWR